MILMEINQQLNSVCANPFENYLKGVSLEMSNIKGLIITKAQIEQIAKDNWNRMD